MPFHASLHHRIRRTRAGFTLTELLVVVAVIVLLVGLLLAALSEATKQGDKTTTLATMQAFANACDTFHQEHGYYPGVVPERILANDPQISGMENALLHLMGGYMRAEDVDSATYNAYGGVEIQFDNPSGGNYLVKVDVTRIGEGPLIDGKPYPPYLTPDESELVAVEGQALCGNASADYGIPDLVDAWGQPIIALRRARTTGRLVTVGATRGQFEISPACPYLESGELGALGFPQELSILRSGEAAANLEVMIGHPSLVGQARGAIFIASAGADGIFFSANDGPGTPEEPIDEIATDDLGTSVIEEYDDVIIFAGS